MSENSAKQQRKLNPEIYWLVAIFLLALILRTAAVLARDMIVLDEPSVARAAENLLLGHAPYDISGLSATRHSILYPLVTASFSVITRNEVAAGYTVSVLFSSMLILPTYLFGKVMWNMRVGRAAAALVAVLPFLVDKGSTIDGQNVFAFWMLCAMFFGYRMQFTKRCMCGMLAGTCLGFAYLSNPGVLYYLVVLFIMLVIVGLRQELSNYANKAAVHFVLMFLLFAIPNVAYLSWQTGAFTIEDRPKEQTYAAVNNLEKGSPESEQEIYGLTDSGEIKLVHIRDGKGTLASFIEAPARFTKNMIKNDYEIFIHGVNKMIPAWLLPLIGLGLFKFAWTRREGLKYGFFTLMMAPLVIWPMLWANIRFVLPFMGIVMLAVARGWVYLGEWSAQTAEELSGRNGEPGGKTQVQVALAALILLPLAFLAIWNVVQSDYPVEFRAAGEKLANLDVADKKIMSREESTAWYAGGTQLELPYASVEETLTYGRKNGAGYLVMSRSITDSLRPQLLPLMDPANAKGLGLKPVYHSGEESSQELIIYRFEQ